MAPPTDLIPHRPPYLFLTEVLRHEPTGCDALAVSPEHPAQLIEVCAQAAAATQGSAVGAPRAGGVMVGVRRFDLHGALPEPGSPLRIEVRRRATIGDHALFRARVLLPGDTLIASGELALAG